jgi:ElaB/YqjD/DUF883 family membrane-anchored ribosome-binding protein
MDENNRTSGTAGTMGGDGGDGAESESASDRFGRAREFMGSTYNNVRERVEDVDFGAVTDQVRTYVRSNPGKALLISVGVGFAIGLLLRGSDADDD